MRNILVVSVNWLGDVVFSTPVYRALKAAYPRAMITVLAVPRVKEVLELCPDVDQVIVYDEKKSFQGIGRMISMAWALRQRKFDAVFILRRSSVRTLMTWLAGIPVRVGYADNKWPGLLTCRVDDRGCDQMHRRDVYLKVIETFGVKVKDRSCYLEVGRDACERLAAKLRAKGLSGDERIVVLNTGGNWALKQWLPERFAELAARLSRELGLKVVLPGAASDLERVRSIARASGVDPVILAGETDLKEMAALFKRAFAVISADSGPLHVASAVGANVVALFGPTRPEITGPCGQGRIKVLQHDVKCNRGPCYYLECPDNQCMKAISVDDVFQTFKVLKS
ncbi:MAG: lipopolysaccharide heptosyltransferase II [Candidatus Omnitrophica bacterium]|nr:lipopolysaccharide heptosyltransferase II [Candidatus Omnitrophota bacterium]